MIEDFTVLRFLDFKVYYIYSSVSKVWSYLSCNFNICDRITLFNTRKTCLDIQSKSTLQN